MFGVDKITKSEDITLVTINSLPSKASLIADIFEQTAKQEINIDMISQTTAQGSNISISFTLDGNDFGKMVEIIKNLKESYKNIKPIISSGNCKISLFGEKMPEMSGVASRAISTVAKQDTDILMITTSEVDISFLIPDAQKENVIEALEQEFKVTL